MLFVIRIAPLTISIIHSGAFAREPPTDSNCVSNRGKPYDEKECKELGHTKGCSWNNGTCTCPGGQSYSRRERHCKAPGHSDMRRPVTPQKMVADASVHDRTCVSNRGQPYDEKECKELGPAKGCSWNNGTCSCASGQSYSRRERHCKAPGKSDIGTLVTFPVSVADARVDDSTCVSNRGKPYDEKECKNLGLAKGCSWKNGACSCAGWQSYSRRERHCKTPGKSDIRRPVTLPMSIAIARVDGSTCVSNRAKPYVEEECKELGPAKGCSWNNGTCSCPDGQSYSQRERHCEASGNSDVRMKMAIPLPSANGNVCVAAGGTMYDEEGCTNSQGAGCAWMNGTCICVGAKVYSADVQRCVAQVVLV